MDKASSKTIELEDFTIRLRTPPGSGPHPVVLLLHGWTGDEDVMWVFADKLPKESMILAPRGLYPAPMGGYSWHPHRDGSWPWIDDFRPAVEALLQVLVPESFPEADFTQLRLMGFSQGAALAYTFSLLYPVRVMAIAGLSGFLPDGSEALARNQPLKGKPIFVAHGSQDETVPVGRARQAVEVLEAAGAKVTYCEDDVGHKLSAKCFRALETFFKSEESERG